MQTPKTAWLECQLTEEEITEKGKSLARAEEERDQNAAKKKAAMAVFKSTDDGLASVISQLTTQINNGREYRNVETSELPNYETNLMEIYRRDTGERINTRPLTTDELQLKFGFHKTEEDPSDIFREGLRIATAEVERLEKRKAVVDAATKEERVAAAMERADEQLKTGEFNGVFINSGDDEYDPENEAEEPYRSDIALADEQENLVDWTGHPDQEPPVEQEFTTLDGAFEELQPGDRIEITPQPDIVKVKRPVRKPGWTAEEIAAKDRRLAEAKS